MKTTLSQSVKFIITVLLTVIAAYAVGIYGNLPWWSFVITNILIAIAIPQKPIYAFLSGVLGIGLLWFSLAFIIDNQNQHLLSTKVANVLPLHGSYISLIILTTVVGALLGGLAALTGSYIRKDK
jgi:hypothetical protein